MNFCQKHLNHHCIHAHSCKNPDHKKIVENKSMYNKKTTECSKKQSKNNEQSCTFIKNHKNTNRNQINDDLLKKLHQKQIKICQLQAISQKFNKMSQENIHLYAQIEYYREQFTSLIENNSIENKNAFKKQLKETTDLILKIKILQSQNITLKRDNEKLINVMQSERLTRSQNKEINHSMQQKYNLLHYKLKDTDRQRLEYRQEATNKNKQLLRVQEKYLILKKQFGLECENYKKENRILAQQLENIKKQCNSIKNMYNKEKQLTNIDKNNELKKEQLLKGKLSQFERQNKQFFNLIKVLKDKNQQLQDDLLHAKTIIDKRQQTNHQLSIFQRQMEQKVIQNDSTIIKEKRYNRQTMKDTKQLQQIKDNKENMYGDQVRIKYEEQINLLKQKIRDLEKHANYQQIILNMGASEAFKKLLEDKNTVIKKLMREKGQIYSKMSANK